MADLQDRGELGAPTPVRRAIRRRLARLRENAALPRPASASPVWNRGGDRARPTSRSVRKRIFHVAVVRELPAQAPMHVGVGGAVGEHQDPLGPRDMIHAIRRERARRSSSARSVDVSTRSACATVPFTNDSHKPLAALVGFSSVTTFTRLSTSRVRLRLRSVLAGAWGFIFCSRCFGRSSISLSHCNSLADCGLRLSRDPSDIANHSFK
jgi:hypothetical protein